MPERRVTNRRLTKPKTQISTVKERHFVLPEGRQIKEPKRNPIGIYKNPDGEGHVVAYRDTRIATKDRRKWSFSRTVRNFFSRLLR